MVLLVKLAFFLMFSLTVSRCDSLKRKQFLHETGHNKIGECCLVSDTATSDISSAQQLTPKLSQLKKGTTGENKNLYFFYFGVTCPFKNCVHVNAGLQK